MNTYGTTSEQLGAVAVAARQWAAMNPLAQMRDPITLEDHQSSRMIADPLRLLDCCLVSNGAVAVIVTSADRAATLRQPPVHVWGWGQAHPGYVNRRDSEFGLVSGAARSGPEALKMAGVSVRDIDVRELYDCFTYTTLITLEDYGFCAKGEGGPFAASGALGPGGEPADQHRRRRAVVVLHVGHDPAVRGGDPGPRPGRRAAGRPSTTWSWSAATAASSTSTPRSC